LRSKYIAVPASMFGMVLGIVGLGGSWRIAARVWALPSWPGEAIIGLGVAVWLVLLVLYAAKWVVRRQESLTEFHHPVQCCFVGIVPVSTALVGLALRPYDHTMSLWIAGAGIAGQLVFGVYRTGELWKGDRDPAATTPVLYLPTVAGSFVSAIALGAFGFREWGAPFFGAGLLSWLAIESVLIHRLYVVSELAPALRPTLGIALAPPAVGCLAYLSLTQGPPDLIVKGLLGYAFFQSLVLSRLIPWIAKQPFAGSYWAFSFGIVAFASSAILFIERGGTGPIASAAPVIFILANAAIGALILGTLWLIARGRLLPPAPAPAASPAAAAAGS
jgi:tellurite resistance protein